MLVWTSVSSPSYPWQAASPVVQEEESCWVQLLYFSPTCHPLFFPLSCLHLSSLCYLLSRGITCCRVGLLLLLLSFVLFPLCSCNSCLLGDHPSSSLLPHPTTSPRVALSRNSTALPEKEIFMPKYFHCICPDPQSAQPSLAQPKPTLP